MSSHRMLRGAVALSLLAFAPAAVAQEQAFGTQDDVAFAKDLWAALEQADLVGRDAIVARPYEGTEPHGVVLINLEKGLSTREGVVPVIVKSNYGGEGVTVDTVYNNPDQNLGAVTVMLRRPGYDPDHRDWFWAKYLPDGSLDTGPEGTPLAGKVAGCIGCHGDAEGGDFVFNHNRYAR